MLLTRGTKQVKYETTGAFSLLFLSQHLEPPRQLKKDKYYILLAHNFWEQVWDKNGMFDINNSQIKTSSLLAIYSTKDCISGLISHIGDFFSSSLPHRGPPDKQITFRIHQNNQIPFKSEETSVIYHQHSSRYLHNQHTIQAPTFIILHKDKK